MRRRGWVSALGGLTMAMLLAGTSRLSWNENHIEEGPSFHLTEESPSLEFNIEMTLEMCEPGPEGDPVSLFLDLSAGFDLITGGEEDTGAGPQASVTLYPGDGSPAVSETVDLSSGSVGSYLALPQVQCPAFGTCERSYVAVFEISEGSSASVWWTLTASAMSERRSDDDYEGSVSVVIEER